MCTSFWMKDFSESIHNCSPVSAQHSPEQEIEAAHVGPETDRGNGLCRGHTINNTGHIPFPALTNTVATPRYPFPFLSSTFSRQRFCEHWLYSLIG